MPKNPLSDLDEILAKSQRLTTRFNDAPTSFRYLNRGVSELGEASRLLTESADSRATDHRVGDDTYSRNIFNEINAITLRTVEEPVQLSGTDLDNYLAHHHDMIVLNAIQDARQTSDSFLHDMQQRWIIDDWDRARSSFFESLGHRANKWGLDGATSGMFEEKPSALSTPLANPGRNGRSGGATTGGIGSLSDPLQASRKAKSLNTLPPLLTKFASYVQDVNKTNRRGGQRTAYCESLLKILQDTVGHHFLPSVSTNAPPALLQEIQELQKILSAQDMNGFRSLLSLISSMTGETQQETISPGGFFSSLCFDHDKVDPMVLFERKQKLTYGGKNYFEKLAFELYQKQLIEVQKNATSVDALRRLEWSQRTEGTSLQAFLVQYIKYESKQSYLPGTCQLAPFPVHTSATSAVTGVVNRSEGLVSPMESIPYWTLIFHALRIGSFQIPIDVLEYVITKQNRKNVGEESLLIVIKFLHYSTLLYQQKLSGQSTGSNPTSTPAPSTRSNPLSTEATQWKTHLHALTQELPTALTTIHSCYKEFMNQQTLLDTYGESTNTTTPRDPYYGLLCNLLGVIDNAEIANSDIQPFIFEDFVWCNMFFIYNKRILLHAMEGNSHSVVADHSFSTSKKATSGSTAITPPGYHYPPSPFRATPHAQTQSAQSEKSSGQHHGTPKAAFYDGEEEFLELIYSYGGVNYFDPNYANPYKYALLLFLCHRFGDGILHLYQCDAMKLFPTIHLLTPLLYYGLLLPHTPLLQNPYSALVMSQYTHSYPSSGGGSSTGNSSTGNSSSMCLDSGHDRHIYTQLQPITVLLSYMTLPIIQSVAPDIALDYFFTLQTSWYLYFQPMDTTSGGSSSSSVTLHTPYGHTGNTGKHSGNTGNTGSSMSSYQTKEYHRMKYEDTLLCCLEEYLFTYVSIECPKDVRDRLLGVFDVPVPVPIPGASRGTVPKSVRKDGKVSEYLSSDQVEEVFTRLIHRYLQLATNASATATVMTGPHTTGTNTGTSSITNTGTITNTGITTNTNTGITTSTTHRITSVSISYTEMAFALCLLTGEYTTLCAHLYTQLVHYWLPVNFKEVYLPVLTGTTGIGTGSGTGSISGSSGGNTGSGGIASTLIESQLLLRQYWKETSEYYLHFFTTVILPTTHTTSTTTTHPTTTSSASSSASSNSEYKDYLYAITLFLSYEHMIDTLYYNTQHHALAYEIYRTIPSFLTTSSTTSSTGTTGMTSPTTLTGTSTGSNVYGSYMSSLFSQDMTGYDHSNPVLHWVEPILDDLVMIVVTMLIQLAHAQQQPQSGRGSGSSGGGGLRQYTQECQELFQFVQTHRDVFKQKEQVFNYFYAVQQYIR